MSHTLSLKSCVKLMCISQLKSSCKTTPTLFELCPTSRNCPQNWYIVSMSKGPQQFQNSIIEHFFGLNNICQVSAHCCSFPKFCSNSLLSFWSVKAGSQWLQLSATVVQQCCEIDLATLRNTYNSMVHIGLQLSATVVQQCSEDLTTPTTAWFTLSATSDLVSRASNHFMLSVLPYCKGKIGALSRKRRRQRRKLIIKYLLLKEIEEAVEREQQEK